MEGAKKKVIDSKYRKPYQKFCIEPLLPFAERFSPAFLTLIALLFGLLVPLFCMMQMTFIACASLALSGYFDTLDGTVARKRGLCSPLGAAFDITSDRIVEFSTILGLFLIAPAERGLICILMLGSILICITTFLVVAIFIGNESEKGFHYSPGLIERAEAFVFFGAMLLFPKLFFYLATIFSVAVFVTALLRLLEFKTLISARSKDLNPH